MPAARYLVDRVARPRPIDSRPPPNGFEPAPPTAQTFRPSKRDALFRRALAVADAASLFSAVALVARLRGNQLSLGLAAAIPLFILVAKASGLYDRDEHLLHKTTLDEVPALFGLATVATLVIWLADGLVVTGGLERLQVLVFWALLFVAVVSLRALARVIAGNLEPGERCLILGSNADAEFLRRQLEISTSIDAEIVGTAPPVAISTNPLRIELPPGIGEVLEAESVDRVIVANPPRAADGLLQMLRELRAYGVKVSVLPDGPRVAGPATELDQLPGVTLLGVRGPRISFSSSVLKRTFDIVGSGLGLLILSVPLILIAIAIKIDSPGPVFFRQRRVGRHGRGLHILKFRSMVNEAEQLKDALRDLNEGGDGMFKIAADPRITRVGGLLRRYSLDELPQLWNVLRGEMSLVGPRPLIEEEDHQIEGWHRRRLEVLPGMTGHWQILHSSGRITLDEMAKLDYLYVANWSPWNDIRLLLRTVPFVVGRRGV